MIQPSSSRLIDPFGRQVSYLRLSVTDRCDLRCVYCMSEKMTFLPRDQVLSLEELYRVAAVFAGLGVTKVRVTGGEPLVRKDIDQLLGRIGELPGIDQLAITTNGTQLVKFAESLKLANVTALNISLDTLDPSEFTRVTRVGQLSQVVAGIEAAAAQGFERIRINTVVTQGSDYQGIADIVSFAADLGVDVALIEEMPLKQKGDKHSHNFERSDDLKGFLSSRFSLTNSGLNTGGPARYLQLENSATRIGFISPMSNNFCGDCNRVRVTVEGKLLLCLGNEHSLDLRALLRGGASNDELQEAIINALQLKPERHHFDLDNDVEVVRFMSETGG